ncbi:hypothetical protein GT50_17520 [Geobacillus stearothermophilus 10]|nr:hypothetical protein GT50_17520 [Geobacillus stearothermophilus 10]
MREMALGLAASFFFAVTFILNRSMELAGGSWTWSSSLRFFFMVPLLSAVIIGSVSERLGVCRLSGHCGGDLLA